MNDTLFNIMQALGDPIDPVNRGFMLGFAFNNLLRILGLQ